MRRTAIMVGSKGRGSNMIALATQIQADQDLEVAVVISPKEETQAVLGARSIGLPVKVVPFGEDYTSRLRSALSDSDFICLAGYMKLFPIEILRDFQGRVLNIHPALLPKYGGKGMYGHHVHEAVVAAGETTTGCTIHHVSEAYDEGDIVLQSVCEVEPWDTAETVAAKVLALEHVSYFKALKIVANGLDQETA